MSTKKKANNAFAALDAAERVETVRKQLSREREQREHSGETRERVTVHVSTTLADRARRAVYFTPGLTLVRVVEHALEVELARLEKANGGPFGAIPGDRLPAGRPIGRRR